MLYFTLVVGSANIDINLSDSEAVYGTTGSPGHRLNMISMSTSLSLLLYFTLNVGSIDIDIHPCDPGAVSGTTSCV